LLVRRRAAIAEAELERRVDENTFYVGRTSMTLGSIVLKIRQTFGHGLRVAYWRDIIRPRIMRTQPIGDTTDKACEIHVLTSGEDWLNLVWALKSFYWASKRRYALCIHGDCTLQPEQANVLRRHFPHARVIERRVADQRIRADLARFPRSLEFRLTNVLAPKVFDFPAYLESDRMLLLDSDVLFFSEPTALLRAAEDTTSRHNCFNADIGSAYTVEPDVVSRLAGFELKPLINSGIGHIHRASLNFEWVEEFLQLPGILEGHFWRIEQTLYALCSSRFGVQLLPDEYRVRLDKGIGEAPCRHYVGAIRHLMYSEGMRQLVRLGFLEN
jgi:hypothetical protein